MKKGIHEELFSKDVRCLLHNSLNRQRPLGCAQVPFNMSIKERCEFKILLLTYKCFNGLAPTYLEELLHKRPDRGSRRDNDNLLIVPKVNRVTFGGIAFKRAAPYLWNNIPSPLRKSKTVDIFKSGLKTLLFKRALYL